MEQKKNKDPEGLKRFKYGQMHDILSIGLFHKKAGSSHLEINWKERFFSA